MQRPVVFMDDLNAFAKRVCLEETLYEGSSAPDIQPAAALH